ncbi:conserved hypothetical protein [Caldicellulosiruptor hydrothermalis 108]|uniref:Uncharacterized protein n=1 Tax=Caldicellulosiruptor hydrothermalis (strain DSM 18901 / VKM B-2411 / 108) TaxID=632292 RepID=E4QBT9_CALH1|nr:hypothetical protein [Caldicellulosiruptor hydrothermalis]ADQ07305.1 conserved hypothetical protein [Caldicellulosiruptor hydrothermalis 108]
MKVDILNVVADQFADKLSKEMDDQKRNDYESLLNYVKGLLASANTIFNFASDQDLIEIAIYQQILAEKWLNYLYKILKQNPH